MIGLNLLRRLNRYITNALLNKTIFLRSTRNTDIIFKKIENSISSYHIVIGKMNITDVCAHINRLIL